jgi:hypothetical protein
VAQSAGEMSEAIKILVRQLNGQDHEITARVEVRQPAALSLGLRPFAPVFACAHGALVAWTASAFCMTLLIVLAAAGDDRVV